MLVLIEADRVEDVELRLGTPERGVRDPGLLQVELGLLRDVARIAAVHLAGDRVSHEAVDVDRRVLRERIHVRGVRIGHEEHVRLLDLLEAADRGSVEPDPFLEDRLRQLGHRDREVLHQPRQVAEPEIDDLGSGLLGHGDDVLGCRHCPFPLAARRPAERRTPNGSFGSGGVNSSLHAPSHDPGRGAAPAPWAPGPRPGGDGVWSYRRAPAPRAVPSPKRRTVTGTSRQNGWRIQEPRGMSPARGTSTEILSSPFMAKSSAMRPVPAQSPSESFPR